MKTQLLCLTLAFSLIASGLAAQKTAAPAIHQVGINFSNLNAFGLHYKTGNEKTLLRLSLLSMNLGTSAQWAKVEDSVDVKQHNYGAGFRIGFEKKVPVVAHFDFIWGLEAGCNFNYQKMTTKDTYSDFKRTTWDITPLIDIVLGVNYTIADHLVLGAEITPNVHYSYGKTKYTNVTQNLETTNSSFGFGFTNNSASLSVAYRFGK